MDILKKIIPKKTKSITTRLTKKDIMYESEGLTPKKLSDIFKEADNGNLLLQSELFEQMEEKDAHIYSLLQTRKSGLLRLGYDILPASDSELDVQIANFVKDELSTIDFDTLLINLMDAVGKGFSVCEIIWKINNGKVSIDKTIWINQKHFLLNENKLKIIVKDNEQGINMENDKFIVHINRGKSGDIARVGVLRVIAWMYLFKNYNTKDWFTYIENYGMPIRIGKYSKSASQDEKRELARAVSSIGSNSSGIIPDETNIELIKDTTKSSSGDVYYKAAKYLDAQMSKAILGQTLTTETDGTGSYAATKIHNQVREDILKSDAKAISKTLNEYLIAPLVKYNFSNVKYFPKLKFHYESEEDKKKLIEALAIMKNELGYDIPKKYVYETMGIPIE